MRSMRPRLFLSIETLIPCYLIAKSVEGDAEISATLLAVIFETLQRDKLEEKMSFLNEVDTRIGTQRLAG